VFRLRIDTRQPLFFPADELANRRHISIPDIRDCTALFGRATEDGHRGICRKVHTPKGSSLDREMLAAQQICAFEFACEHDPDRKVEMPSGLSLPLAFGINTLLIGSGR
jgi:hypothetical protein